MRRAIVITAIIGCAMGLLSCGSTGTTVGPKPRSQSQSAATIAESEIHRNYAQVAVADDSAVVADGTIPTRFSIADLASDDPVQLRPLDPPVAMMFQFLARVGDQIVVLGNQCDGGVSEDGTEIICNPGTALAYTFAPATGKWSPIPVGIEGASFGSATMLPSEDSITTVNSWLTSPAAPNGERVLFTLDAKAHTMSPQNLPPGYSEPLQGGRYQCFASSGAQTMMVSEQLEDVPDASPSRIWWRATPRDEWTPASTPPSTKYAWNPDSCISGMLVVSIPDGNHRRRIIYSGTSHTWRDLPENVLPEIDVVEGLVHEPSMERRWINGQIWTFSDDKLIYHNTGTPVKPLGYVRWSVPWGRDKVAALVDDAGPMGDPEQKMDLRIKVVTTSGGAE